jgi:hypothetical protein
VRHILKHSVDHTTAFGARKKPINAPINSDKALAVAMQPAAAAPAGVLAALARAAQEAQEIVRIPVNVTADSCNVTGNSGERDRGSVLRVLILCRLAFPAVFPRL